MKINFKPTLRLVWALVEVAAAVRAGIATWIVTDSVMGSPIFTLFTVGVIEGVFIASLFLIGTEAVAPIAALLALAFSGAMQWLELRVTDGSISEIERGVLRFAIAFAPIVILGLAYLRRLMPEDQIQQVVNAVLEKVTKPAVEPSKDGKVHTERSRSEPKEAESKN